MAQNAQNELDDLYGDVVLDHCRTPRNSDTVEPADLRADGVNPFCGDEVHLQIALNDDQAARVGVQSVGCSINRASASMMSEALTGKSRCDIVELAKTFRAMLKGDAPSDDEREDLGELTVLEHVREFPVRIKCALLPWSTLEDALAG